MEELLLKLNDIEEQQKTDKARIAFLEGFIRGLEERVTVIEQRCADSD